MKKKVCVITGSRADYGMLYWLIKGIEGENDLELQIIATGMHLSPEFGLTYRVIEEDGLVVNEKVEMLLSSDTVVGITKSIGVATIGFADAIARLKPDMIVVLGDRYEILAAAQAALIAKIPIAHLAGGDTTEGAFDEAIRHSITKMSHLHFVTNEISAKRVRQLGENPQHIYNVGSTGIDYIKRLKLLSREDVEQALDLKFKDKSLLITFHPATLDAMPSARQMAELFSALDSLSYDINLIFTKANADTEGRALNAMVDEYIKIRPHARAFTSLGQLLYLSTANYVDAVVGNSSSGLYEIPSLKKPAVNIGIRQKGRLQPSSVINCIPEAADITRAIEYALSYDCSNILNPYGDGNSSSRILSVLKDFPDYKALLSKRFYEVE